MVNLTVRVTNFLILHCAKGNRFAKGPNHSMSIKASDVYNINSLVSFRGINVVR